ncbi:MAG: hypothetical protein JNJ43_06145 [Anaerolineales bacterium]|nr:hypothetical protein [Anaerolineales bacterium]
MNKNNSGARFAVGLAMGIAIGVALDNLAIGMAIGGALGMAFGSIKSEETKENDDKKGDNNESK